MDAAGALGEALADRHEDEGRADADRAGQHGERDAPQAQAAVGHQPASLGFQRGDHGLPYRGSLARVAKNRMPGSTTTAASGRSSRRCSRPPDALMPPSRIATGTIAIGLWRARNDTRMPATP